MTWRGVLYLYRIRLRRRYVQELLALVGIAVGVALLFSSQVVSASLTGSVQQLTSGIIGRAQFQLAARSPYGMSQRVVGEVQRLPGVDAAVPVLEETAVVVGPRGERSVQLIGTEPRFARLGGSLLRHFSAGQLARQQAIALPTSVARSIGVGPLQTSALRSGASTIMTVIGAELTESEIGSLADSPLAIAPLAYAQKITGLNRHVTRIFVLPRSGADHEVERGLERLAADNLNVEPADFEASLFRTAARPTTESTQLFSALSALVGFLFAVNAMLLTVPRRRAQVAGLRLDGYHPATLVKILLCDALVLGVASSSVGLALGDLLSVYVFRASPSYLAFAFPVGSQRIVTWQGVTFSVSGGLAAAATGVLAPLRREILGRKPRVTERVPSPQVSPPWILPVGGLGLLLVTCGVGEFAPGAALIAVVSLTAGMLLLLPGLVTGLLAVTERVFADVPTSAPFLAVRELRSRASRARTFAVAATGAVAVFGSVAIQGSHANLVRGLYRLQEEISGVADVWIAPPGVSNLLTTTPFQGTQKGALAHLRGVRSVDDYRAGLLDYDERRVWVLAPPRTAAQLVPANQIVNGSPKLAATRVRDGGWAVVSQTIAAQHHLRIGQTFTLPSPKPTIFRVAALSTNIGWSPGAIIINAQDFATAWADTDPTAYNVTLRPDASPTQVEREIRKMLGPRSGLSVYTAAQLDRRKQAATRQGLTQLTQISDIVLVGAILAMAAAMGSMLWQRRMRVAHLKLDGLSGPAVWRALLFEASLLLGAGCAIGAAFGLYGQFVMTRALVAVTGYPVVVSVDLRAALGSLGLVSAVAVAIVAVPGYVVARVDPVTAAR